MPTPNSADEGPFVEPPDPGTARTPEELVTRLRLLRVWAGNPTYARIARQVNDGWRAAGLPAREWTTARATVADCFTVRPRGPTAELLLGIVSALHADPGYVARWRQAIRVVRGEAAPASLIGAADRLPPQVRGFVGRGPELAILAGRPTTVLQGMPGVGKTALALRAGHELVRAGVADRVLFADLRGFHPERERPPADPAAVLAEFLRLLGVPGDQLPVDADPAVTLARRAALYRDRTRGLRLLVLLDDAADADQVRPLLPDGPACRVLVTSRRALPGLPALAVDVLAERDALTLIRTAAGDRYEHESALAIARLVGHLPLALSVLATRIRDRGWPLADHVERLLTQIPNPELADRVELALTLRIEDRVRLALDLSYEGLADLPRRVFRRLALHPGQDADGYAAAALAELDLPAATAALAELADANLLRASGPGRYVMHSLIRAYAADRARDEDAPGTRRAAQQRLLDQYRYIASQAWERAGPEQGGVRLSFDAPAAPTPDLATPELAAAWLDTERPNLIAVGLYAAGHGWLEHASDLSTTLDPYLCGGAYWREAELLHTAAARTTDRSRLGRAMNALAHAYLEQSRYGEAEACLLRALAIVEELGDRPAQAEILNDLGETLGDGMVTEAADATGAIAAHQRALAISTEIGQPYETARAHLGLARALGDRGHADLAVALFTELGVPAADRARTFRDSLG